MSEVAYDMIIAWPRLLTLQSARGDFSGSEKYTHGYSTEIVLIKVTSTVWEQDLQKFTNRKSVSQKMRA